MCEALVAAGDEVVGGETRGSHVVDVDETRAKPAHTLEQHERDVAPLDVEQVREVGGLIEHRREHQPFDAISAQCMDGAALDFMLSLGARDDEGVSILLRHVARAEDDLGVIWIVDFFDNETETRATLGMATPVGRVLRAVIEHRDRAENAVARVFAHGRAAIEHGGDGRLGDVGKASDIVHRCTPRSVHAHRMMWAKGFASFRSPWRIVPNAIERVQRPRAWRGRWAMSSDSPRAMEGATTRERVSP